MRVHLVDGTFELFRAHFSKRPEHADPQGKPLKATVGVVQSLLGLLEDPAERPTHLAVAFDNPIRSFRNQLFDGYKTEEGVAPELLAQFDDVERGVAALGLAVWSMKEFEADDALAAGAAKYAPRPDVEQVRILSPDKDLGQCLGPKVVQVDRMRGKVVDEARFRAEKHFAPQSVPDFLALVGDTADGIPGVQGWGAKSTAEVLARHPHLEQIPDDVGQWAARPRSAERLAAALKAARKDALLYRTLATVRTDVPLPELEALEWQGVPREPFVAWCRAVGHARLEARPTRWR